MSRLERWLPTVGRLMLVLLFATALHSNWRLIAEHGVPVPFHDQWTAEGVAVLEPWFAGDLGWDEFWKPSNEHRPVITRLLMFAEFRLTGRWDTRLQMLVNGFFHAVSLLALGLLARHVFPGAGRVLAIVCIAMFLGTSGSYENAVWGFQSQLYLMVLLGVLYLGGTFASARTDARWIAAQIAGALGLLTMAGGLLAPLAAAALAMARLAKSRDRHSVATLGVAAVLALLGWWMLPVSAGGGPLQARSAVVFVEALLKLLAWPSPIPLTAAIMQLPWLIVAARTLVSRDARPADLLLTALGAWILLQAAAIAFARGTHFQEIAPRYFDILSVGMAVNAACVYSTWRSGFPRAGLIVVAIAWQMLMILGLAGIDLRNPEFRRGRLEAIIESNEDLHRRTLSVVRDYVATGDPAALARDGFVAHHFPSIEIMRRLLDNPGIRASLPPEIRGEESRAHFFQHAALTLGASKWPAIAARIILFGALLLACLLIVRGWARTGPEPPTPWFLLASIAATAAVVMIALGMRPWDTDPHRRVQRILEAAGAPVAGFDVPGSSGGIFALPSTPAGLFFGTYIGGDGYTGAVNSTEFTITGRFLVVPVTGYPAGPGNSLGIEFLGDDGSVRSTALFREGNPMERISPWLVEKQPGTNMRARLVLVDGSTEPRGWLGVGTPRVTDDPAAAARMSGALASIEAEDSRRFPAVLLIVSIYFAAVGLITRLTAHRRGLASAGAG